jgi:NADPH:quinone reductase-like Zn-dependent oxidoreductase
LNGQPRPVKIHESNRTAVRSIDQTRIVPVVDSCYSLADLPAAFDDFNRGAFGEIVIDVAE